MKNKKIRYGIVGAGYLGTYHAQQIQKNSCIDLVGVFDIDPSKAKIIANNTQSSVFKNIDDLLQTCDAVSICTPASRHFEVAKLALENRCHLFIEKPVTDAVQSAKELIKMNNKMKKIVQVGHIERFNPAFIEYNQKQPKPLFVESHRLSKYNIRGMDVPVVLDLMIHDIDLILNVVKSKIKTIDASGASVVSNGIDLANARITFQNGCVANLTASRISNKQMRQMRIFENKQYSIIDFQTQTLKRWLVDKNQNILDKTTSSGLKNTLYMELNSFVDCLNNKLRPAVGLVEAYDALKIAIKIQKIIEQK